MTIAGLRMGFSNGHSWLHHKMYLWILMSDKTHKADLALLLRLVHCFGCAVGSNE
jgi:hypothetical protein